jgi:putative adhesin
MVRLLWIGVAVAVLVAPGVAQSRRQGFSVSPGCTGWDWSHPSYCEDRETTISAGPIDVDASPNGGIRILGADRPDVLVHARVQSVGDTLESARRGAAGVRIETAGGRIRAEGPDRTGPDQWWAVSYVLEVPRVSQLTLTTHNGGIAIEDFRGTAELHTQNGGVSLRSVGGDIRGETTNGGLAIDLDGDRWDGTGLDVQTRNGGVRVSIPETYSAELEIGTVHGRLRTDFPLMVQGRLDHHLTATLGAGGARLRATTTNGGVTITRK